MHGQQNIKKKNVHRSFRQQRVRKEYGLLHPEANTKVNPQLSTYHIKLNCTAITMRRRTKENICSNIHHRKNRDLEDKIKTRI